MTEAGTQGKGLRKGDAADKLAVHRPGVLEVTRERDNVTEASR